MNDKECMSLAINLALNGTGTVNPNPLVGAVIAKDGKIIGTGWHQKYGGLHAERNAFKDCSVSAEGADMYVTLEPCCHYGKTPPCTEAIIENKIKRVFIGSSDPNPLVAGKGIKILKDHGIEVIENFMKEECDNLNPIFFHYIKTSMPYVILKYAITIDGKIATRTGKSKWITGETARNHLHFTRKRCSAIMTGIGTVLADDPMLNCRIENPVNPIRIICDSTLRIPLDSNIVKTAKDIKTYVAACNYQDEKANALQECGVNILNVPSVNGRPDMYRLFKMLGDMKIDSVLTECGAEMNYSILESKCVNEVHAYIAPKIFGGKAAVSPVGGIGIDTPDNAYKFKIKEIAPLGDDIIIKYSAVNTQF